MSDGSNNYATIKVSKADVPVYLQSGEFYLSLNADEADWQIEVPANSLKSSSIVNNTQDLIHLLTSLRFWVVVDPQLSIIDLVLSAKSAAVLSVLSEFEANFPYLSTLRALCVEDENEDDYSLLDRCALLGDVEMVKEVHRIFRTASNKIRQRSMLAVRP